MVQLLVRGCQCGELGEKIVWETEDRKLMYSPNYVFHDGIDPVAYHLLSKEPSEVIHETCAKTPSDREFPLYPEDIEAMRNLEPIICDVCERGNCGCDLRV